MTDPSHASSLWFVVFSQAKKGNARMKKRCVKNHRAIENSSNEIHLLPLGFPALHHILLQPRHIFHISKRRHFEQSSCPMPIKSSSVKVFMLAQISNTSPLAILPVAVDVSSFHLWSSDAAEAGIGEDVRSSKGGTQRTKHHPMGHFPVHPFINGTTHLSFVGKPCAKAGFQRGSPNTFRVFTEIINNGKSGFHQFQHLPKFPA